jgi:hypothetical protein
MNDRLPAHDLLVDIEALRLRDAESALERLNSAPSELKARAEAKLLQAELVYQLRGPAAAQPMLLRVVADFPNYGSAYHLLGRVQAELGDRAAKLESFLAVHALDAVLDDALEDSDVASLERALLDTATEASLGAPSWVRRRLAQTDIEWRGRPSREQVRRGVDPRALATLEESSPGAGSRQLSLVLYRTNLLASGDDEAEVRENLRAAVRGVLERTA